MSHEKMSDFVWFPLRKFSPAIKQRNLDLESFWNSLIFFDKKYMTSDLNMSHGKMSDFVSFSLFGFTLMMMMMMMNCFCGMVDWRKAFSLISSRNHCQRSSPSRISDTPRAGFEPAQSLSSGLVEWSCAVVITTTPRRHKALAIKLRNFHFQSHWNTLTFFYQKNVRLQHVLSNNVWFE